jgi:acetyl-CoA synthetase
MTEQGSTGDAIETYSLEDRRFPPPEGFKEASLVAGTFLYDEAARDVEGFWARQAADLVDWRQEWHTICEWELPFAKWFVGGTLNVSENCLDRHVAAGNGDKVAYHWEGEPGDTRTITYADLLAEVCRFANVLKDLGVARGDRVNIYLPMIPELPVAMLACARLGAAHSVVFGGFSADSLADRINDAEAKVLVTADGGFRRGSPVGLKDAGRRRPGRHADDRARRGRAPHRPGRPHGAGRDRWWHDVVPGRRATARPRRWTPSSCCSCCTRAARRPAPRGSCTRAAAT